MRFAVLTLTSRTVAERIRGALAGHREQDLEHLPGIGI